MPAAAQDGSVLREGLFGSSPNASRRAAAPMVARYVAETGDQFVFDRSSSRPLLRFADHPEVWALHPQSAPRGDVIYKNDLGQPVLRATKLGGLTLFTRERPQGAAVAVAGESGPIRLAPMGPNTLLHRLAQASARASKAAQRLVTVGADATPSSAALIADTAMVAAEAMTRMSRTHQGRAALGRINKIFVDQGKRPAAGISDGVLVITVRADMGIAGRPSSERIAAAAGGR
ncbi:MAG TPA: DUF4908 domain-containing protein [Caulobacteraceae bacterium]|nr:DUF4908 domain-containing protein [Caulobacteraceae bacterium]